QSDGAAHHRQAHFGPGLPDLLAQPRHDHQRSDRAARDRGKRSAVVDPVAQRGRADLRARVPGPPRVLMRRVLCARSLLCVLCGTAARPSYAAVQDYIGRPIASVKLFTEGRETTDPVLTSIVETAPGASLSMLEVRESVAHLFSLGQFEGVSVDAELENGRVALRYELIPIHPVTNIRFARALGGPGLDPAAMPRATVDRYGVPPPLGRVADMTRILTDALRERGYLSASVVPRPEIEHAPERATLVFTIDPGPRTIIGQVDIVGVPTATRPELLKHPGVLP